MNRRSIFAVAVFALALVAVTLGFPPIVGVSMLCALAGYVAGRQVSWHRWQRRRELP